MTRFPYVITGIVLLTLVLGIGVASAAVTVTGISPANGPEAGGTTVIITGTELTGATSVMFGSEGAASFSVDSDSQITAVSPAGTAGTVDVTVETPAGTSALSPADEFTYNAPGSPTVTGISPANGPEAGGTTVIITGTELTGATSVMFGSEGAAGFSVDSDSQITAVSPAGTAGTVDVTVETPAGTSALSPADEFTYSAPGSPTVTGISPARGSTAGGTTVIITGTDFTGATSVMFGSEGAASFTVDSATRITAVSPAGTLGSVHVTVTTPEGTSAPGPADRFLYGASDDQPVSVTLTIRPTTLNTGSKGVFTVYVTLYGEESAISPVEGNSKPVVDFNESYLACSGSEMIRSTVSNKNGGTLIAKFHRQDLEEVTSGDGVEITCSGTLFVNGEYVDVEGSDTIRVIGEKKGLDRIFSDLMKYLGLEEDDGAVDEPADGTVALPVTLNPDDYKNAGQMKKALKNTVIPEPAETGQNDADTAGDLEQDTGKNNGNAKKIKDENAGDTSSRGKKDTGITSGNRNTNKDDDTPRGNPNNNKNR